MANGRNGLPTYSDARGQLDASISYTINAHFSISANALNINNAREFTYQVIPSQTFTYALTGRHYLLGARGRF